MRGQRLQEVGHLGGLLKSGIEPQGRLGGRQSALPDLERATAARHLQMIVAVARGLPAEAFPQRQGFTIGT
jgi:hypothetical protein